MNWNLTEALSYYKKQGAPSDQTALIALLKEIQSESGGSIPAGVLPQISDAYSIKESILHGLIRRIPSLRLGGEHVLELCAGPNCSKHTALARCAQKLHKEIGRFTLQYSPCMRMCGKGPNIKWDGKLYHQADEPLLRELIEESKRGCI